MNTTPSTLGRAIAERRGALGLSLKDLGRMVRREEGRGVSAQYLHDIERDRRIPSANVLRELARALGVDPYFLGALAGQAPAEVIEYLREHPGSGRAVMELFARASSTGFQEWDRLALPAAAAPAIAKAR
jgi:transcriptional regulator with XRE-family HTH domain